MVITLSFTKETDREVTKIEQRAKRAGDYRLLRRISALRMIEKKLSIETIANVLSQSEQTVRNWFHTFLSQGVASLVYRKPPGRPSRLTKSQKQELKQVIVAGPEEAGYASACWTALMVQEVIQKKFGISYSVYYVCQLLRNLGFSYQKARFVSDHLNEEAREKWLSESWPQILAEAKRKKAMILFGDEATCALWGSLGRTWALRGQQPEIKTSGKRKGYKILGMVEYFTGQFFFKAITDRFNSASYEAFLCEVLAQTANQHLIIIQDGARYHTSAAMKTFFAQQAARMTVYQLPSYSPDFNPIEFLWKKLKQRATHNRYFDTFAKLIETVDDALVYFAKNPKEILSLMGRYCETLGEAC